MLIKPLITEKTMRLAQTQGKFTFLVNDRATKLSLKSLLEKQFQVNVVSVRIAKTSSKLKRFGRKRLISRQKGAVKAIFTLKPGQTIEYFQLPKEKKSKNLKSKS